MKTNGFLISKGNKYVAVSAIVTLLFIIFSCSFLGFVGVIFTLFLVYVFRNDSRHIFVNTENILSPVDGKVLAIDKTNGKVNIYCDVNFCSSHKILAPIGGNCKIVDHKKGLNLNPDSFKASLLNEQVVYNFKNEETGKEVDLKLIAGKCNANIEFTDKESIEQGETVAIMIDGMAIVTLNEEIELSIKIGDSLKAGQTNIIGTL